MLCLSATHRYCSLWMMPSFSIFNGSNLSDSAAHTHTHTQRERGGGFPEALVPSSRLFRTNHSLVFFEEGHVFPWTTSYTLAKP